MSFVSIAFVGFYIVAMLLRFTLGRSGRSRSYMVGLLMLSIVFYSWHVPAYFFLIFISTLTDHQAARALAAVRPDARAAPCPRDGPS